MGLIKVELVRRNPTRELAVKVTLCSEANPRVSSIGYWDPDDEGLEHKIATLAGALAEHQCEVYGDRHCPGQIASMAGKMMGQLIAKGRDGPGEQRLT